MSSEPGISAAAPPSELHAVPALVVTQGDPAGIGPELLLRLGAADLLRAGDRVIADLTPLRALADQLAARPGGEWAAHGLAALEPLIDQAPRSAGQVSALVRGVDLVLEDPRGRALVTAPIDKAACRAEGFPFPGHTEYLAARAGVDDFAMLMVGPRLRVVLATIHLPLREVPLRLDVASIVRAGRLLARALREHFTRDSSARPVIGVLGLNPHAGERGMLGDEEQTIVGPAIAALREWAAANDEPVSFRGPLPADTAFPAHADGALDGLVAMYHDQGLAPFKLLHMRDGVNMTLGLPFIRTSPDHGTARDIAGRGVADPSSMFAAVALARGATR
ncbi:4-hydroxythreonine-4-phosphate dehydrogenase PdxA [Nannocystis sp.]|uniref:4-hydroxythreonine-4-phosphate dehydrogenase PdxA n=1 Tax=Nannocystis sp. TaxID=1962667 RepID=UPI002426BDD8|nr:4-hydroxythreonine-4-phosphate dehydrogenase PdxA [Nannocystis sp.]MBK7825439.1 4-hydroxythreonine-4-phosphate dehydrogenase PdxA [Nannocystis sp.]MBK9757091.1 4-hydroxythreonine-4-phosphate dehydrogenase PdxA [Nannocystis sp.]